MAAESIKAGRIRALGVAAKSRNATLPDVPTFAEKGQPLEVSAWFGLMAPTGTPPAIIDWLNREANNVFSQPDVRNRFLAQGAELPLGTPDDFRASSIWNIASGGRSSPRPISGSTEFASKPRSREGMTPTLKPAIVCRNNERYPGRMR